MMSGELYMLVNSMPVGAKVLCLGFTQVSAVYVGKESISLLLCEAMIKRFVV